MDKQPHLFQINKAFLVEASHYERTGDTVNRPCLVYFALAILALWQGLRFLCYSIFKEKKTCNPWLILL